MSEERRASTGFERHFQTGLTTLGVLLIAWVGLTSQMSQVKLAELTIQVKNLEEAVRKPEPRVDDIIRRVDAIERIVFHDRAPPLGNRPPSVNGRD